MRKFNGINKNYYTRHPRRLKRQTSSSPEQLQAHIDATATTAGEHSSFPDASGDGDGGSTANVASTQYPQGQILTQVLSQTGPIESKSSESKFEPTRTSSRKQNISRLSELMCIKLCLTGSLPRLVPASAHPHCP